jgi:hypothetical protein
LVSFDIFFQRFDETNADPAAVMAVLEPFVVEAEDRFHFVRVRLADGEADVYLSDPSSGLMINRASGRAVWDLMYDLAVAGRFVVLPVGCGTCVPDAAMVDELPDYAPPPVTVIASGAELLHVVQTA